MRGEVEEWAGDVAGAVAKEEDGWEGSVSGGEGGEEGIGGLGRLNEPFVTTFFVWPAVFAVLMERTMTKAAL